MMTLRILGASAGIPGWPTGKDLLQGWFSGSPAAPGSGISREKLGRAALRDAGFPHPDRLGVITGPHWTADEVQRVIGSPPRSVREISEDDHFLQACLEITGRWLQDQAADAVLWMAGDQASCVCLVLGPDRSPPERPALAVIEDLTTGPDLAGAVALAARHLADRRRWIGSLEIPGSWKTTPGPDLRTFDQALALEDSRPTTALITRQPEGGPVGDMLALIRTAWSLDRRTLPAPVDQEIIPEESAPEGTSLYLNETSRPWLRQGPDFERISLIAGSFPGGNPAWTVILSGAEHARPLPGMRPDRRPEQPQLIPAVGGDQAELFDQLDRLLEQLERGRSLAQLGNTGRSALQSTGRKDLVLSLIAGTPEELRHEIVHARKGVRQALAEGRPWSSPKGSSFTPEPLGEHPAALVYPGAFNSYPGMGRELFQTFPLLHDLIQTTTSNISHSLAEELIFPRSLSPFSDQDRKKLSRDIFDHPVELIESGTSLSVLHTLLFKDIFQFKPGAAFGYSLGEISMLWANQIWQNAEESSRQWQRSPLFRTRLFGPKTAVREHWDEPDLPDNFWASFILKAPRSEVLDQVEGEDRVYLTITNAPGELVIAGDRAGCRRVIDKLGCHALPMPFDAVIHNPAMSATYPDFVELYAREVSPRTEMSFYSAAGYAPLTLNQRAVAESAAAMTCSPVDFPRLVNTVYNSGVRIFVEVGPQRTCSRWIERILENKPHAVIAANKKYQPDDLGILKVLSLLVSHRVPLDLSSLSPGSTADSLHRPADSGADRREVLASALEGTTASRTNGKGFDGAAEPRKPDLKQWEKTYRYLEQHSSRVAAGQQAYLTAQASLAQDALRLVSLGAGLRAPAQDGTSGEQKALYTTEQIQAFTTGDPADCFGDLFSGFGDRRIPRLPNGPLRLIDRVLAVDGQPGQVQEGAELLSAYDVPDQVWYLADGDPFLPYVSLMEAALQPCGFLSAYQGTIQDKPGLDFYFRNLDGKATLHYHPEPAGQTMHNRVRLLSSSTLGSTIIQNFSFQLSVEGSVFFEGTSSFGYFTPPMLRSQAGLDRGQSRLPWYEDHPQAGRWLESSSRTAPPGFRSPALPRPARLWSAPRGGSHGKGYFYLQFQPEPGDWYFKSHFYQDPVMPGSLGVELIAQALQLGASDLGLPERTGWRPASDLPLSWKYRGQIKPESGVLEAEIHLKGIHREATRMVLQADASLWNAGKRIYQITDLCLELPGGDSPEDQADD